MSTGPVTPKFRHVCAQAPTTGRTPSACLPGTPCVLGTFSSLAHMHSHLYVTCSILASSRKPSPTTLAHLPLL